ncbi:MAG: sulfate adenylyltransferase, partial [Thiomicrorhabdus sp.]|nr:sulfate adenylyltransferase [Thiomicrorhabdus sp.]
VSEKKLYLTYVKAIRLNQAHMVLTYFKTPQSTPLVLDNINKKILKATKRNDLVPVYSFNGDGLWLAKQRGKGRPVSGGTTKLKAWNNLLERLKIQ